VVEALQPALIIAQMNLAYLHTHRDVGAVA